MITSNYQHETPTDGFWKFVRILGRYRWVDGMRDHSSIIADNEIPEAAGTVFIFENQKMARMESGWSMTLKIGADTRAYTDLVNMFAEIGYEWHDC